MRKKEEEEGQLTTSSTLRHLWPDVIRGWGDRHTYVGTACIQPKPQYLVLVPKCVIKAECQTNTYNITVIIQLSVSYMH